MGPSYCRRRSRSITSRRAVDDTAGAVSEIRTRPADRFGIGGIVKNGEAGSALRLLYPNSLHYQTAYPLEDTPVNDPNLAG
jgi:hypothetical protein